MNIKDILILVDTDGKAAGSYALSLAPLIGAHVTAAAFVAERPVGGPFSELPPDLVQAMYEESRQSAEVALEEVRAAAGPADIKTEIVTARAGETVEDRFRWLARHFDLTIAWQPSPDRVASNWMVEAALFGSGRPVVLVPYAHKAPAGLDSVVVAWDGSATAARAVGDALPLLEKARHVEIVTVTRSSHLSDDPSSARMREHLARHGVNATPRTLPQAGGVAETLLSHAADVGADLLVMGGYGHSRLRELVLGGVTRTMIARMTIPTLLAH